MPQSTTQDKIPSKPIEAKGFMEDANKLHDVMYSDTPNNFIEEKDKIVIFKSIVVDNIGVQLYFLNGEWYLSVSGSQEYKSRLDCINEVKQEALTLLSIQKDKEKEEALQQQKEKMIEAVENQFIDDFNRVPVNEVIEIIKSI